jgi:LacI family transcriptional regulator
MHQRITMTHVARAAGVHPTTVSLAFRHHPSIPSATRERIQRIAVEIGYRPDPVLSALNAYRHEKIAHHEGPPLAYVHDTAGAPAAPAHRELLRAGAFAHAEALGYRIELFELGASGLTPTRLDGILRARGIAGVLLATAPAAGRPPLELDWSRYSTVKIERHAQDPALDCVATDCHGVVRLAIRQVTENGYRRIGLVLPRRIDEQSDLAWSSGFLAAQLRLPAELRLPVFFTEAEHPGAGADCSTFARWYARHQSEAVLAHGTIFRPMLAALGLDTPRDVAFVDLDRDPRSTDAGVEHPGTCIGAIAVDLLVNQMRHLRKGLPDAPTLTLVGGMWREGSSLPSRDAEPVAACAGALMRQVA